MRWVWACLFYNLINLVLLALFFKEATTIRGDGPGGFGEFALKGLFLCVGLAFFIAGMAASILAGKQSKPGWTLWRLGVAPLVLLVLAALGVHEACSDGAGHCRHWQIYVS